MTVMILDAPCGRVITGKATTLDAGGERDINPACLAGDPVEVGRAGVVVSDIMSDGKKPWLLADVLETVGNCARVMAGMGTHDTWHTLYLASLAHKARARRQSTR